MVVIRGSMSLPRSSSALDRVAGILLGSSVSVSVCLELPPLVDVPSLADTGKNRFWSLSLGSWSRERGSGLRESMVIMGKIRMENSDPQSGWPRPSLAYYWTLLMVIVRVKHEGQSLPDRVPRACKFPRRSTLSSTTIANIRCAG